MQQATWSPHLVAGTTPTIGRAGSARVAKPPWPVCPCHLSLNFAKLAACCHQGRAGGDFMGPPSRSSGYCPCDSKPGSLLSASCREGSPVPQRQGDRVLGAEKVEKTHRKIIHTPPHRSTLNPFMHVSIQTTYKSTI